MQQDGEDAVEAKFRRAMSTFDAADENIDNHWNDPLVPTTNIPEGPASPVEAPLTNTALSYIDTPRMSSSYTFKDKLFTWIEKLESITTNQF